VHCGLVCLAGPYLSVSTLSRADDVNFFRVYLKVLQAPRRPSRLVVFLGLHMRLWHDGPYA
jgi:hypothetical protein